MQQYLPPPGHQISETVAVLRQDFVEAAVRNDQKGGIKLTPKAISVCVAAPYQGGSLHQLETRFCWEPDTSLPHG